MYGESEEHAKVRVKTNRGESLWDAVNNTIKTRIKGEDKDNMRRTGTVPPSFIRMRCEHSLAV